MKYKIVFIVGSSVLPSIELSFVPVTGQFLTIDINDESYSGTVTKVDGMIVVKKGVAIEEFSVCLNHL